MSTFIHVKFYSVGGKTHSLELLSTAAGTVDKSDVSTLDLDSFYIIATLSVHLRNKSRSSDNSRITDDFCYSSTLVWPSKNLTETFLGQFILIQNRCWVP